jgi:voltage-gated potassium channel
LEKKSLVELQKEYLIIHRQYILVGVAAIVVLFVGAIFYHLVEHFSWLNSFYFCVITLTTIGYGDIVPKTDAGKIFTIFYVIVGIGIIATFANILIKNAVARRKLNVTKRRER